MVPGIIIDILRNSKYKLSGFTECEIFTLSKRVNCRQYKRRNLPVVECILRNKVVKLTPDEVVRQLYIIRLVQHYGYAIEQLGAEYPVTFGREIKNADLVIFDKNYMDIPYIIVEIKKSKFKEGKAQLRSYCNATGAPFGVWTNGEQFSCYQRREYDYFEHIRDIPRSGQNFSEVLNERFTIKDLFLKDKITNERKSLKEIIQEMEDEVLSNAGVEVFEEVFKLLFTKLYDEYCSRADKNALDQHLGKFLSTIEQRSPEKIRACLDKLDDSAFRVLEFHNFGQTDADLKIRIQNLFDQSKQCWPGIFPADSTFNLSDSHLAICISGLQDIKLFSANLLVMDEAFEYLVNKSSKGEKGQYFTPRHVIDMCVHMLNPKQGEYMIDTASGSFGFPVHTLLYLNGSMLGSGSAAKIDNADAERIFGIDFDEKIVRVARTLNLLAGDGEANVLHLNTLDFERWNDKAEKDLKWMQVYGKSFERLKCMQILSGMNKHFNFDLLMANPPFAGDIKESRILYQYELGFKNSNHGQGVVHSKLGRDILFIERNLDFLKPGGRMAVILPQGRLNNTSDKYIREFIARHGRILAVVGLHSNTFKPHTGIKTSVLFIQKWHDELCPWREDYPVFFAVSENSGKDSAGNYTYVRDEHGQYRLDRNGCPIVEHDLHSHGGELPDGIVEAFIKWAKAEKLSFWS